MHIFCPQCDTLILDQPTCAACGWQRPPPDAGAGAEVWRYHLGQALSKPLNYPVIAGNHYCVATGDGLIIALDLERGQLAWKYAPATHLITHALASDGERIFVAGVDPRSLPAGGKSLLALDARTGQEVWRYPTQAHSLAAATVAEGEVYTTAVNGWLHAIAAADGQLRWTVEHPNWGPAAPAVGDGIVCAGGRGDTIVAYALEEHSECWRYTAEGWFATRPVIAAGQVFAWCWDGSLYAFDVGTGQVRWRYRGERGQGLTSPPTVAGERLFVGSRVYREINGARHRTYALLCLRVADGSEVWRFHTPTYVSAPIAVCDDRLFCSTDDGGLSALDINSGAEVWQVWRDAPVVTRPRVYGDQVIVATQPGEVVTIRRQAAPPPEPASPESYLQQGDPLQAAVAYALRGDFAAAAQIYADQDQPHAAAQLYERAHLPARAATLWAELGQLERARELYRSAGDQPGLAGVLERLGDKRQAARLYVQARQWAEARRIWEELGAWEEVVALLIAQEEWLEAAQMLEQHGQLEPAAGRYEQAGALPAALRLRVMLEQWERVVDLAGRVGAYETAAAALERLGQPAAAAAAYVQAAQQALAAPPADEAQLAGLYEQAAQLYLEAFDPDQAAECRRAVRRHQQLPKVIVVGKPAGILVEYQWNALRLQMENSGYGPAYDIRISFESDCFDAEQIPTTPCLFPQTTATREVSI